MKIIKSALIVFIVFSISMKSMSQDKYSYLALGDSYTIGELVEEEERWPVVLSKKLNDRGIEIEVEKIIATTGWTTDELIEAINKDKSLENTTYDIVSLLIGVNNQYRGYGIIQYEEEFEELLKKAITLADKKAKNVFVVSIPDYGVTPFVKNNNKNGAIIAKELKKYNKVARNICEEYGVEFFDITPLSLKAIWNADYVAKDDLHPSAKMYEEWADYIEPGLYQLLNK